MWSHSLEDLNKSKELAKQAGDKKATLRSNRVNRGLDLDARKG